MPTLFDASADNNDDDNAEVVGAQGRVLPFQIDWSRIEVNAGDQMVLWRPPATIYIYRVLYRVDKPSSVAFTFNAGDIADGSRFLTGISGNVIGSDASLFDDGFYYETNDEFIIEVLGGSPRNGVLNVWLCLFINNIARRIEE